MLETHRAGKTILLFLHLLTPVVRAGPTLAGLGADVTLGCQFDVHGEQNLVVEWSLRTTPQPLVVYSFHHGQPHPEYQDPRFQGRVTLNQSRLEQGDAGLRLRHVTAQDEGLYRCIVITTHRKQEQHRILRITAPYSRPGVSCSPQGGEGRGLSPRVTLSCQSAGGYPSSQLSWLWTNGSRYTGEVQGTNVTRAADGSFGLHSWLEVERSQALELCCLVHSPRLNQTTSGNASCPEQPTLGTQTKVQSPGHCLVNKGPRSPHCSLHLRTGLVVSVVMFLILFLAVLRVPRSSTGGGEPCPDRGN